MRESQMKKLVALAVAGAFIAPVYAADISISGSQEWSYQDNNGNVTNSLDGAFSIKASATTATGLKVSADINVTEDADYDGGSSLTVAGPFGKLDMGETSGAVDAIDGVTDWGYVFGQGTGGDDASVLWTLPSFVDGLTVNVSYAGNTNDVDTGIKASNGFSLKYSIAGLTIGYGQNDFEAGEEELIANVTYSVAGVDLAYEQKTDTSAVGVDIDKTNVSAVYGIGDVTLALEMSEETAPAGTTSADITVLGLHYSLGGGLTAFIEQLDNSKDTSADATAVGVVFKF
jgi:hypothetical protein